MTEQLRWCVGKFTHSRGTSRVLHFMPLQPFHVDHSLDMSHLFYLRAQRVMHQVQEDNALRDESFADWVKGTAVEVVAETVIQVLNAQRSPSQELRIREYCPGVGLTFEYLKTWLERLSDEQHGDAKTIDFTGVGPKSSSLTFNVLHADERHTCEYEVDDGKLSAANQADLVVYNQNQSLRDDEQPVTSVADFISTSAGPAILAVRATTNEGGEARTTIKGRQIDLPSVDTILECCRASLGNWHYRFIENFDADFLLPPSQGTTGLLLAYRSDAELEIEDFLAAA